MTSDSSFKSTNDVGMARWDDRPTPKALLSDCAQHPTTRKGTPDAQRSLRRVTPRRRDRCGAKVMRIATGEDEDEREATASAAALLGKLGGAARAWNLMAEQRADRQQGSR